MKRKALILCLSLTVIASTFVVWREFSRGTQYRLGITLGEARAISGGKYPTQMFGVVYDGQPTPKQMNEDALYFIYDEGDGVMLMFNHHETLIQKKRIKLFGVNVFKVIDSIRMLHLFNTN